ncbi:MAG TPA: nitrate ABC transporter substrate-binding protein, partial [Planctomycetota bacterium]|nr:nitrate ABC transporter substrate-binding protein [Planctomycetota bacterium]
SNEVDAVWGSSITLFDLEKRGIVKIIDSTRGKDPRLTLQAHLLVTEDFEQRYPRIVQRVVDVIVKEAAWAADESHRDELFALWSKAGYAVDIFAEEFRDTPLRNRVSPLLDDFFFARYRDAEKTSLELKLIRRGFEVEGWLEPKYVQSAIKRFGLEGTWPEFDAAGQPKLAAIPAGQPASNQPASK